MTRTATARKPKPAAAAAVAVALAIPALKKGEIYIGAIVGPEGHGEHVILLPGEAERLTWQEAMDWATKQGGNLPNRSEFLLMWDYQKSHFKREAYWSNTQDADERWAWYQLFRHGSQGYTLKDSKLRARAVRRVPL